jgi:hypothetical protein
MRLNSFDQLAIAYAMEENEQDLASCTCHRCGKVSNETKKDKWSDLNECEDCQQITKEKSKDRAY